MSKEIERKFITRDLPDNLLNEASPISIIQGYIALEAEGKEVRLRNANDHYTLTVKSSGSLIREELEITLSKDQFHSLWPSTLHRRILKERYKVNWNTHTLEVDRYQHPLNGLFIIEIEFDNEMAANRFVPEKWMGKEVTQLNVLKNKNLFNFKSLEEVLALL
jgi:adenylate cyclase